MSSERTGESSTPQSNTEISFPPPAPQIQVDDLSSLPAADDIDIVAIKVRQQASFSGPLPHPSILAEYDDALPGCAERIVALTEKSLAHSLQVEMKTLELQKQDMQGARQIMTRGQLCGLAVCLMAILCGTIAVIVAPGAGAAVFGSIIGGVPLATVVIAFMTGKTIGVKSEPKPRKSGAKPESSTRSEVPES